MNKPNTTPQNDPKPTFFQRIPLAFGTFFSILSDAGFAARIRDLHLGAVQPQPQPPVQEMPKAPRPLREAPTDAALQLLSLLQRDARLIDFTEENLSGYSDADIGAAARLVHEGCRKVLREHFTIEPVRPEAEGSRITLNEGFDASAIRITGNVVGQPPFNGNISHRGWRATEVRLPKLTDGHDATVCAQAEVEL
jgi:hypothetical protein